MLKLLLIFNAYYVIVWLVSRMGSETKPWAAIGTGLWAILYLWAPDILLVLASAVSLTLLTRALIGPRDPEPSALATLARRVCGYDVTGFVVPARQRPARSLVHGT